MVFCISHIQFEAFQCQTAADRQTGSVTAAAVVLADFHLVATTEIIAGTDVNALADENVCAQRHMLYETGVPAVQSREGDRKA